MLTKNNHLGAIFAASPQKASNLMVQLMAYHRGKSLDTLLSMFPTKSFDTDDEYTWQVVGSSKRNIPLKAIEGTKVGEGNIKNYGVNGEPFYLIFAEDWFADGEVLAGPYNEAYPLRVLGDAIMEGTDAKYKVELMGGITTGVPEDAIPVGGLFSVDYAPVEAELSRKVGDVRFAAPVAMRNEFSRVRIQHKVPGSMLGKKLAVGIPVLEEQANGKVTSTIKNLWMHVVEWEVEKQFSDYKNNVMAFGRSNRNNNGEYLNIGKSGNVIRMGDGLFAQMEVANTQYYTHFSLKLLEDALLELSTAKLGLGDRYFVIRTGRHKIA